ncbi:cytochrome P450 4A10-like [Ruditapes philippinarum]|uniref:cytochrome P450 4A10-like n=1 Tax=Ruditapes philippinarum TaxID=129788 RepID=UPI00295B9E99|nr:cytochrome P450 4A10-like [Ruditapes philippinarum]
MSFVASPLWNYIPLVLLYFVLKKVFEVFLKRRRLQAAFKDFPGPKPEFFGGNTHQITGDYAGLLRMADYAHEYPGAFPAWTGPAEAQLISVHPGTAKVVLSGTDPKDEFSYALMRPWIGDGLLLSKGKKWDRNRRLMTPAFHADILKNYVIVFSRSTKVLIDKWRKSAGSEEVFHHISLLTLDSMMQCLFGYHSNCQNEKTRHPYIQGVYDVSELIVKRIIKPLHHYDFIYYNFTENGKKFKQACHAIHEHSEKIIKKRKQLLKSEAKGARNVDFLDILLTAKDNDGDGMTDQEIRDEVDTFMFEGHDSTASTISWCLYNLAKHQACQDRCREEILKVVGKTKILSWDDLTKLEYMYACIQESMRLFPAVPNISRCLERDLDLPDGRVIPKDMRITVSLFAVQRDPEVWDNPNEFDPDRFTNGSKISSVYHLPFSIGPRNCIGQHFALTQVKVVICELLRHFKLDLDPERKAEPECILILRSKNGLYLKIKPV